MAINNVTNGEAGNSVRSKINELILWVNKLINGDYALSSELQNAEDSITSLMTLTGVADSVNHNAAGPLVIDLSTDKKFPVDVSANITGIDISNGVNSQEYKLCITTDNDPLGYSFSAADLLDDQDAIGIYNAGDKVLHPNGRIYKAAALQSNLRGDNFDADLLADKWYLHIRFNDDAGYYPSIDDEDILHIECLGTDYYKITPQYGS